MEREGEEEFEGALESQTYVTHLVNSERNQMFIETEKFKHEEGQNEDVSGSEEIPRIHNKNLPPPPSFWKEMTKHPYTNH